MIRLIANKDAYDAYHTLYYPIADGVEMKAPSNDSIVKALTAQDNVRAVSPYEMTKGDVARLACVYETLAVEDKYIDPAADLCEFLPDAGTPFYDGFPEQVIEMSEAQFRLDQIRHYMSTYGIEALMASVGVDVSVRDGYMPERTVDETEEQDEVADKQIVNLCLSCEEMHKILAKDVSAPSRMASAAVNLLVDDVATNDTDWLPAFSFHENMMEVIAEASVRGSKELGKVLSVVASHPGDIFKAVLYLRDEKDQKHLSQAAKRGFRKALKAFPQKAVAQNIADLGRNGLMAAYMLSPAKGGGSVLRAAVEDVRSGKVKSYNAVLEQHWNDFTDGKEGSEDALIAAYAARPGVLLRSVSRLVKGGVNTEKIGRAIADNADAMSPVTLCTLATQFGSDRRLADDSVYAYNTGRYFTKDTTRPDTNALAGCDELIVPAVAKRLAALDTPVKGKKVFIPESPFSLEGSVVLPNQTGNCEGAYPPVGMAYTVPDDKKVRFFCFWNDQEERVDVDLHFSGANACGVPVHIGWNGDFRDDEALVFSGDVTTSNHSAEYLDVDFAKARRENVEYVVQNQHIYSGRENWNEIQECYCGALVVDAATGNATSDRYDEEKMSKVNQEIYSKKNVIFHDDMTGTGRQMDYALVNVADGWVRLMRGGDLNFVRNTFNLEAFIDTMFSAQGATVVENAEEADIVLTIGRDDTDYGCEKVCLIDENFFLS